jgi:hypothetical protein
MQRQIARLFRLSANGMVAGWLLSWAFDRLTVPLTFRPNARIKSQRAAQANASALLTRSNIAS